MHEIPIYDVQLEIVVASNVEKARIQPKRVKRLGKSEGGDWLGLWANNGRLCSLFLLRGSITHKLIAHELIHAVHGIMTINSVNFGPKWDHETPALLSEYLAGLVYGDLKRWKIRVK